MQGGEDEVSGLGSCHRRFHGRRVAHFADQDDIRVFTQYRAEACLVALGVGADFALVDDAFVHRIDVLNRIFERDDVFLPGMVDFIKDGCQGRGLAGASLAGDQHDALLV